MRHLRSKKSLNRRYKNWEQYRQEQDSIRGIVLSYSFHDLENGEKVFTVEFKSIVEKKLKIRFGCLPDLNHEYGEVLNRFLLHPFGHRSFQT